MRLISTLALNRVKQRFKNGNSAGAAGVFYQFQMNRQSLKPGRRGRLRSQSGEGADRSSVQIGCAPASLLESQTRLLYAESVAREQLLRLCLRKSEHLFGNHEQALLGAKPPHRRRRQTSSQNEYVCLSRKQRKQTMEERDYPIGVDRSNASRQSPIPMAPPAAPNHRHMLPPAPRY